MTIQALQTGGVIVLVIATLIWTRVGPHLVLPSGLVLLLLMGVIDESEALRGFANPR